MSQMDRKREFVESGYWQPDCNISVGTTIAIYDDRARSCISDDIVLRTCMYPYFDQSPYQVDALENEHSSVIVQEPDGTITASGVELQMHLAMESNQQYFRQTLEERFNMQNPISISELDGLANEVEQSLESALAKMQILVSSDRKTYGLDIDQQELQRFSGTAEYCKYSVTDALRLVENLPDHIRSKINGLKFVIDGRGNVDIEFDISGFQYEWKVMKSDLNWPMIRVLEYKKLIGTKTPPSINAFYNVDSLYKSFQKLF